MSTSGSTLFNFKTALVAALTARSGLAGVSVSYGFPDFEAMPDEAIWFEGAESEDWDPVMKSGTRKLDERYKATLMIQVLKDQGEDQSSADSRASALLAEVQAELAEHPQPGADVMWATFTGWRHFGGELPNGGGHGSRFECKITVRARLDVA